jgi:hypothetical protein
VGGHRGGMGVVSEKSAPKRCYAWR